MNFTSDFWSDPRTQVDYLALSAHYYDDGQIQSYIIRFEKCDIESKSGDSLALWFERLLNSLFVQTPKFILVTNSELNFVRALKSPEKRISCIGHSLHLAVTFMFSVVSNVKSPEEHPIGYSLKVMFEECNKLAIKFRRMPSFERLISIEPYDYDDWTSALRMFISVREQYDRIKESLAESTNFEENEDWDDLESILFHSISFTRSQLEEWIVFLTLLQRLADKFVASKTPTLHIVVPHIAKLLSDLKVTSKCSEYSAYLKKLMLEAIKINILPRLSTVHFAATLLDFRFKSINYEFDSASSSTSNGKLMLGQCIETSKACVYQVDDDIHDELLMQATPRVQSDELQQYFLSQCLDLKTFYNDDNTFDVFRCWEKYKEIFPNVYRLATWLLSVPATCIMSQRNLSLSSWRIDLSQSHLDPKIANNYLIVKSLFSHF
jgi:hypothetical protein